MRILHTSDWHLGRSFFGMSLEDDHAHVLRQVEAAVGMHQPDLLIIAGDIFDRATPPQSAMNRLRDFLVRVAAISNAAIVIIAGNHDAAAQIGMLGVLAPGDRTLVRGPLDRDDPPLLLEDADGTVAISALPFAYEFAARACFENDTIACPADVIAAQITAARSRVPQGARWVVVAHSYVEGASTSENERSLSRTVGTIETVPSSVFDGAHYVALGHLHRPQSAGGDHIRYSGAPLAFGFDEEGQEKSLTLIDMAGDGSVSVSRLPLIPLRQVRTLRGKLQELLAAPAGSDDFIRAVLTDDAPQIDPMKRIRALYPNAVQLAYDRDTRPIAERLEEGRSAIDDPETLAANFLEFVRSEGPSDTEAQLVAGLVREIAQEAEA